MTFILSILLIILVAVFVIFFNLSKEGKLYKRITFLTFSLMFVYIISLITTSMFLTIW
jgi:hypothetical protein